MCICVPNRVSLLFHGISLLVDRDGVQIFCDLGGSIGLGVATDFVDVSSLNARRPSWSRIEDRLECPSRRSRVRHGWSPFEALVEMTELSHRGVCHVFSIVATSSLAHHPLLYTFLWVIFMSCLSLCGLSRFPHRGRALNCIRRFQPLQPMSSVHTHSSYDASASRWRVCVESIDDFVLIKPQNLKKLSDGTVRHEGQAAKLISRTMGESRRS